MRKEVTYKKELFDSPEKAKIYAGTYVLESWDFGLATDAYDRATVLTLEPKDSKNSKKKESKLIKKVPEGKLSYETLAACLIESPFGHSPQKRKDKELRKMPGWLGLELMGYCSDINPKPRTHDQKKN
jgi:hypothetical protein